VALLKCVNCSHRIESEDLGVSCEVCGSALIFAGQKLGPLDREEFEGLPPGVWRYRAFLPELDAEDVVTLGEGDTPLLPARRLGKELGLSRLLIKDESRNPTGSFIDRGSTVLVSLAKRAGIRECSCVTTGNLGASLAAYCAKAGIGARIRIHQNTDRGKLYQMLAYGAQIEAHTRRAYSFPRGSQFLSVTAANPFLLEGEKTTCFEVVQELGWKTPDVIVVPVGTGGHLSMIWRAIVQLRESGLIDRSACRLLGVQFAGGAPIVNPSGSRGTSASADSHFTELEESEPYFRTEAIKAMEASGGMGLVTTATETVRATGLLARTEGIFAEPASASAVASLDTAVKRGFVRRDDTVVCVITGAGLKDTKAVSRLAKVARRVTAGEGYAVQTTQIGETKLELLRLLVDRHRYGYELWRSLSLERRITTASVYQHLAELEGLALVRRAGVVSAKGRERVLYGPTKKGTDFLKMAEKLRGTNLLEATQH
jgi:threonine synthase